MNMSRKRRTGVYARMKKGHKYWQFNALNPETGKWFTKSVSRKLLEALGITPSGKFGSIAEKDAQEARVLYQRALKAVPGVQKRVNKESTRISELFHRFIEARCTKNGADVIERKRLIFADFIKLHGDLPARHVTEQHAATFLKQLLTKGTSRGKVALAPGTARDRFAVIKAAFEFGRHIGILRVNPATYVALPEKQAPKTRIWTPDQIHSKLTENFDEPTWEYFQWIVVGTLITGLSPMEWQRADWSSYDSKRHAIWIDEVKKKSSAIRRTDVPIPALFHQAFKQRKQESGPIWPTANGNFFSKTTSDSLRARVRKR